MNVYNQKNSLNMMLMSLNQTNLILKPTTPTTEASAKGTSLPLTSKGEITNQNSRTPIPHPKPSIHNAEHLTTLAKRIPLIGQEGQQDVQYAKAYTIGQPVVQKRNLTTVPC